MPAQRSLPRLQSLSNYKPRLNTKVTEVKLEKLTQKEKLDLIEYWGILLLKDLCMRDTLTMMKEIVEIHERRFRRFVALCRMTSREPKDTLLKVAKFVLDEMNAGYFSFDGGSISFKRTHLKETINIIRKLIANEIKFPEPLEEDIRSIEGMRIGNPIENKTPPIWCGEKEFGDGDIIHMDSVESTRLGISVPILPQSNVRIEIATSDIDLRWIEIDDLDKLFIETATYLRINPLCSQTYLTSSKNRIHTFETQYPTTKQVIIPESFDNTDIPQEVTAFLYPEISKKISRLFSLRFPENLSKIEMLAKLDKYLGEASDGAECKEPEDIVALLCTHKIHGSYPGDCKARSTMSVACLNALGFPARRVGGCIFGKGGHVWTELYIPKTDVWVPFDPSNEAFLAYPESPIYCLQGLLPKEILPFDIRVTYI